MRMPDASRRAWVCVLVVVGSVTACAEEGEIVVVGSACEPDRPTTIVRLDSGEVVERIWSLGGELALFRSARTDDGAAGIDDTRLLVATTCGADQRELGRGLEVLATGDDVLACDPRGGTLVRLHANSESPADVLATSIACAVAVVEDGIVVVARHASGFGQLSWIDRDGVAHGLHPGVRVPAGFVLAAEPLAAAGDHVLALTQAGEIVDIDRDGAVDVVRSGVVDFRASSDLRFVVGQLAPADGPNGESDIVVIDRERAQESEVFPARLAWSWSPFATGYLVLRHEAWGDDRVFTLPDLGAVALPESVTVRAVTDVGQIAYAYGTGDWHDVDLWRWDPRDDSHVQLVRGAAMLGFADDGLELFLPSDEAGLQRGDVELRAWDTGAGEVLARDVPSTFARRDDGWITAVFDDDGDRRGTLRLHRGDEVLDVIDGAWTYDPGLDKGRVFGTDVVWNADEGGAALRRVSVPR
jgi:hypothetical protein